MECKFSKSRNRDEGVVRLDGQEIPKSESCRYLGLISHKDEAYLSEKKKKKKSYRWRD